MVDTDVSGVGETGEETALAPVRQRYVDFYGDGIPVAEAPDGGLYVALRPITDVLGLAFNAQRLRVLRDEALIRAHAWGAHGGRCRSTSRPDIRAVRRRGHVM